MLRPSARTRSMTWSIRGWSVASARTRSTATRDDVTRRPESRNRPSISSKPSTRAKIPERVLFWNHSNMPGIVRVPAVVVEGQGTLIRVCGRLTVELQGRRLEDELRGRQGRILLAYLAMHRERPARRDELGEALWAGKGAPPAYDSLLAPPLSRLRKTLGPGVLAGRSELSLLLPEDAWIDWVVMQAGVRTARQALA